jgi:hypothetical protein
MRLWLRRLAGPLNVAETLDLRMLGMDELVLLVERGAKPR